MVNQIVQNSFQIYLLGGLQIKQRIEGKWQIISLPPKRTHGLFSVLLLRPQLLGRDVLANILFPDAVTSKGRQRLRDLLWLLGRTLPGLEIVKSRNVVQLPQAQRWLDVEAFEAACKDDSFTSWREAIALYAADLDSCDVGWLEDRANELQLQHRVVLHEVTRILYRKSQFSEGLVFAQRLVNLEPFDEEALRLLMRYHQMLGQRGAALTAYEKFSQAAEKHLGILPDPTTRQLADALEDALPAELITSDVEGDPLKLLISRTQTALEQTDQEKANHYLSRLQAFVRGGRVPPTLLAEIKFLQVDLAMMQRDAVKARRLLADCDPDALETQLRDAWLLRRQKSADAVPIIKKLLIDSALDSDPSLQVRANLMFADIIFEFEGNLQQAIRNIDKAFRIARRGKKYALLCRTLLTKAKFEFLQQEAEMMEITLQEALTLAEMYNLRLERFDAYDWLISLRKTTGDFETALRLAQQNLIFSREIGIPFYINKAKTILGLTYNDLCEYEEAITVLLEARDYFVQCDDFYNAARLDYSVGVAMLDCDAYENEQALTYAKSATALMRKSDMIAYLPVLLEGEGLAHYQLAEYDEVIACGDEILHLSAESGNISYHSDGLWLKAAGLLSKGDAWAALKLTEKMMLEVTSSQFDQRARPSRYWLHASVLKATGKVQLAHTFLRRAIELIDQIADSIARLHLRHSYVNESLNRRIIEEAAEQKVVSKYTEDITQAVSKT